MRHIGTKSQISRHAFIDRKIREGMRSGRLANCQSMAREYEVSYKTIQRDLDYLKNQCGAPIAYDEYERGYYYTEETYKLPAVQISAGDLFAICVAEKVLAQHRETPIYGKLRAVFDRIRNSLPQSVSIEPSWVNERISILPGHTTHIAAEIWAVVAEALQRQMEIDIVYRKPGRPPVERRVDPYHLVGYDGEWYLICHCHLRDRVLTFAVSRIEEARLTKKFFLPPKDFDFQAHAASRFGIFSGEETCEVRIHFAPRHAPYVLEREWHPSQRLTTHDDGAVTLELTTSHLFEVKRWVLSWGAGVRVLSPKRLREMVVGELKAALAAYQEEES